MCRRLCHNDHFSQKWLLLAKYTYTSSIGARHVCICYAAAHFLPSFAGKQGDGATTSLESRSVLPWVSVCRHVTIVSILSERQCSGQPSPYTEEDWTRFYHCLPLSSWKSCPGMQVDFLCWQQHTLRQGRWNMSGGDYAGIRVAEASGVWRSQPWLSLLSC